MNGDELHPTLWRTCRALADGTRLDIIRDLMKHPGRTVSGVAMRHSMSVPSASICLRALNARGLIAARREGKTSFYSVSPNPAIPWAGRLIAAMRRIFVEKSRPVDSLYRQATAFTHPRRIAICRALIFKGRLGFEDLVRECRISRPALSRHLAKLQKRGFVSRQDGLWNIATPKDHFSRTLLEILAKPGHQLV